MLELLFPRDDELAMMHSKHFYILDVTLLNSLPEGWSVEAEREIGFENSFLEVLELVLNEVSNIDQRHQRFVLFVANEELE